MTASWYCLVVVYTHRTIRFVVAAAAEVEGGNHSAVEKVAVVGADMKTEDHFAAVGTALAAVAVEQSFAAE